ncbi:MAG: hypothetical protein K9G76_07075 [Bacteroidales bacterium]|nr:hypothetical protein [Bacteroidales bacterium]MCF8404548.1 hypothetical protein [Bacteroidales bacterium]
MKNEKFSFFTFLKILNTLSIDVVIGAVLSAFLVKVLLPFEVHFIYWIILPLSVWIVYTCDHLVDAYRLKDNTSSVRHLYFYTHFKTLFTIVLLLLLIDILLVVIFLPADVLIFGAVLGFVAIIYFLVLHSIKEKKEGFVQKEASVALIYSVGIWGIPLWFKQGSISLEVLLCFVVYLIIAFADILILSVYDYETDKKDGHSTLAMNFGQIGTKRLIFLLLIFSFGISIYLILLGSNFNLRIAGIIFFLMSLLILLIISFPNNLKQNGIFRYLVELVFWLPGLILLF